MKNLVLKVILFITLLGTSSITVDAATKKNDPNKKEVEKILKEIGGEHYVDDMKINDICTLDFEDPKTEEDVYYHIYSGSLRKGGYHLIIFDNKPEYLGYYSVSFEPADYEEGAVLLDSGDSDEDGNTYWHTVALDVDGPPEKIRIDGTPVSFVKNPNREAEEKMNGSDGAPMLVVPEKEKSASGEVIDYRDWTITMQGKEITVNAIFEKIEGGKVYIKNAKNGRVAAVPGSALSEEDKEYVKRISAK